jgi:hypothetical protein
MRLYFGLGSKHSDVENQMGCLMNGPVGWEPMWKFLCDPSTEKECFARQLFGNHEMVDDILEGDTLFLHNHKTDVLMGPFEAATDGTMNIVEHTWGGRFPYQVYVTWEDPVYELPLDEVTDPDQTDNPIRLPIRRDFQALSENNTEELLDALHNHEKSIQIITKR